MKLANPLKFFRNMNLEQLRSMKTILFIVFLTSFALIYFNLNKLGTILILVTTLFVSIVLYYEKQRKDEKGGKKMEKEEENEETKEDDEEDKEKSNDFDIGLPTGKEMEKRLKENIGF